MATKELVLNKEEKEALNYDVYKIVNFIKNYKVNKIRQSLLFQISIPLEEYERLEIQIQHTYLSLYNEYRMLFEYIDEEDGFVNFLFEPFLKDVFYENQTSFCRLDTTTYKLYAKIFKEVYNELKKISDITKMTVEYDVGNILFITWQKP